MKPEVLLSFLKEEIKYNEQILKEADFKIKKQSSGSIISIGLSFLIPPLLVLSTWGLSIFIPTPLSMVISGLLITLLMLYLICYENSFLNKLENKINHKFNTESLFDISRSSKVREEHLNQIKLSLTLDQYKALHIKYSNPCYQDVINFLENIDEVNTAITQAEESKHIIISTDDINIFKEESIHNVIQQ